MTNEETIELSELAKEKIRIEKQYQRNAESFANNYFKNCRRGIKKAVMEAYLKIVRDKIIY